MTAINDNGWKLDELYQDYRVNRRVYTDPEIFRLEMKYIFGRSWLFVGHESQVPNPGDYFATELGGQPVVMARHEDGQVYVMYNRCGHRGAIVCNTEQGRVQRFRCLYHGWTFRTNGELQGVPRRAGYPEDFDFSNPDLGMVQLPRVDSYRGFVFASHGAEGPDLDAHLGPVKTKIDDLIDAAPDGEIELSSGVHRYDFPANWKFQIENADDLYHPSSTHESTSSATGRQFRRREGDASGFKVVEEDGRRPADFFDKIPHGAFDHGHTWCGPIMVGTGDRGGPLYDEYRAALEAARGPERADRLLNPSWHVTVVYPNLLMQSTARYLRVVVPIAVDRTAVRIYPMRLQGANEAWNQRIIRFVNITHSAASLIQTDDVEAFIRCQDGLGTQGADWVFFARDLGGEVPDYDPDNLGGMRSDQNISELPMRNQFKAWASYMSAAPEIT